MFTAESHQMNYFATYVRVWTAKHIIWPTKLFLVKWHLLSPKWINNPANLSSEEIILGFDDHETYLNPRDKT
jgi:hypothetical protein